MLAQFNHERLTGFRKALELGAVAGGNEVRVDQSLYRSAGQPEEHEND